jgi:glycosyltransferase involved in cell wall biosynthesis
MAKLNLDFALIPLSETVFNAGKSNIKWVENAALHVPAVTSAVSPYIEWQTENNGIFVANNKESWIAGISMMASDPILRASMAGEAFRTVQEHFDIEKNWKMWMRAFEKVRYQ